MITNDTAWLLVEACRLLDKPMRGLMVCELGNQHAGGYLSGPVKSVLSWLGAHHYSLDLNGQDGALKVDLSQPLLAWMLGKYDIVTNAGTTEHVCTSGDFLDQWQAFKTIHDLAKPTAAIMHVIPDEHGAHGDCGYVYTRRFLQDLAAVCGYQVQQFYGSKSDANHTACLMLKTPASVFPEFDAFRAVGGIIKLAKVEV